MPKLLSEFDRGQIKSWAQLASIAEACRQFKCSRATVHAIMKGERRRTDMDALRKKKAKAEIHARRRDVARLAVQVMKQKDDRASNSVRLVPKFPTANKIAKWLRERRPIATSASTIRRDLAACGFKCYRRGKTPFKQIQMTRRYRFARNPLFIDPDYVKRLIFSDEHSFTANDNTSATMYATSRSKVIHRQVKSKFNVASAMMWAAIGYNYKSPIIWLDYFDGETQKVRNNLNQDRYISKILNNPDVKRKITTRGTIFMQDGAPSHTGRKVMAWLAKNKVNFIKDWPANSPDLNPIEEVWSVVNRCLAELGCALDVDGLKQMVETVWEEYPMEKVNRHVMSFLTKIQRCRKERGGRASR